LKKLESVQAEKSEIRRTLQSLKIIEKQEQESVAVVTPKGEIPTTDEKIRQIGSSYQASKVKKYSGAKTIAPIDNYTVIQKFGDYVDPVYNIKIFNEAVILRANNNNQEVKSVLDGKVVFAKETGMLKNVVIVENTNGIHTIFAGLTKIAPTIKVGSKIKKGYVVGRIDSDLTFEVTQKNFHINPLELIN
ncbi:MAG: peptidoglycan DD-metalloendopeptidase family protein, partial [Campylobacteraceae bacterium]